MTPQDVKAYMARDWAAVRDAKDAYWADRIARLGHSEGIRIAEELRLQARLLNPAWPSVAKILAGRPKDIDDARGLLKARAKEIDVARAEKLLRLLEQALGQSDVMPAWIAIRDHGRDR